MNDNEIVSILKSKSVAVTNNRICLLKLLLLHKQKLVRLREILKISGKKLHRITTYRTLITLCEAGLVYKIIDNNNRLLYAIDIELKEDKDKNHSAHKDHYHFQCISCNSVICLPYSFQTIKLPNGFIKTEATLLVMGYCSKCSTGMGSKSHNGKRTTD